MKKIRKQTQAGYSIMEITIVLVIIIFLTAIVFSTVHKMSDNAKTNAHISDINIIRSAISSLYAGRPDYNGLTETVLINSGLMPAHMITNAWPALVNPWGGGVGVRTSAGSNSRQFIIESYSIPQEACTSLAANAGPQFDLVLVNGVVVKSFSYIIFDVAKAASLCTPDAYNFISLVAGS